ncbi:hypothetical protein [Devosia sp. CN2-171]|uniref:hypothetical protein n=1 Tax=Devosia sp. CN2-171 TaxID=3400909 RepID=UPI003BF81CC6
MDLDQVRTRMEQFASEIREMKLLPAKKPVVFRDKGGLIMKGVRFEKDWYVTYTTLANHSATLAVLQPTADENSAYVIVRRRKPDGRRMPDATLDQLPLAQFDQAAQYFMSLVALIGNRDIVHLDRYPGDEDE